MFPQYILTTWEDLLEIPCISSSTKEDALSLIEIRLAS